MEDWRHECGMHVEGWSHECDRMLRDRVMNLAAHQVMAS